MRQKKTKVWQKSYIFKNVRCQTCENRLAKQLQHRPRLTKFVCSQSASNGRQTITPTRIHSRRGAVQIFWKYLFSYKSVLPLPSVQYCTQRPMGLHTSTAAPSNFLQLGRHSSCCRKAPDRQRRKSRGFCLQVAQQLMVRTSCTSHASAADFILHATVLNRRCIEATISNHSAATVRGKQWINSFVSIQKRCKSSLGNYMYLFCTPGEHFLPFCLKLTACRTHELIYIKLSTFAILSQRA